MGFIARLKDALLRSLENTISETILYTPEAIKKRREHTVRNIVIRDGWLTLTRPNFFGQAHQSPSKRWCVGCDDSNGVGRGGSRESGNGRVILVDHQANKVMHELVCFARPIDAAVSDTGTFIVLDSGFGSARQGDVVAVDREGRERYRRHYCANVFNIGISKCGRYTAVQTANAPNDDGNRLEVLDLDRGCVMFSVLPATGWANRYSFDVDAEGHLKAMGVEHKHLGSFRYSASGEFLDTQVFQTAQLEKGDYSTKLMAARDLLKTDATPNNARKALNAAEAALAEGAKNSSDWESIAHRVRGESYELLGQLPEALKAFDLALSLNSKVGVQKRALALRKKLAAS